MRKQFGVAEVQGGARIAAQLHVRNSDSMAGDNGMHLPLQHGSGFEELLELIVPVTASGSKENVWEIDGIPWDGCDDWPWLRGQVRALRARLVEKGCRYCIVEMPWLKRILLLQSFASKVANPFCPPFFVGLIAPSIRGPLRTSRVLYHMAQITRERSTERRGSSSPH